MTDTSDMKWNFWKDVFGTLYMAAIVATVGAILAGVGFLIVSVAKMIGVL